MTKDAVLIVFAGVIGVVLGSLYAISGFADAGKTDELSKNLRVKNLLWLVGGAVTVLLGDWKLLSGGMTEDLRGALLLAYVLAAVTSAILGILLIAAVIAATVRARARRSAAFIGRTGELVLEYIQFGYRYYRAQLEKIDRQAAETQDAPQSLRQLGQLVATLMVATTLVRDRDDAKIRETVIDQVLDGIEHTVKLFAANVAGLELRTNYMVRIAAEKVDCDPQFLEGDRADYAAFLTLRRYRDGRRAAVCLPLEKPARAKRALPGAPTCVATSSPTLVNSRAVSFSKTTARVTQAAVREFFKAEPYASVLSVPLIWERSVVGVVNVESSHIDVVNLGFDMVGKIADALAPFCVVLGELVHQTEE